MFPNGAVIPDSTFALSYRLAELFAPIPALAALGVLVTLGILVVAFFGEMRSAPAFRRSAAAEPADEACRTPESAGSQHAA